MLSILVQSVFPFLRFSFGFCILFFSALFVFRLLQKGVVRQITINDRPVGRSVDEVLRLVQAFQYAEKHGEVCPANWKPGQDSMKADPNGSKTFFNKWGNK
jgi:alkyl hydroperoxide reductase subunit AhpC